MEPRSQRPARARPSIGRTLARGAIRAYQLTLSGLVGRQCRYLPTCSSYADDAVRMHGVWAGSWMAAARVCRCHPWGASGYDPAPTSLPEGADARRPWRYGRWRFVAEAVPEPPQERAINSAASP